MIILLILMSVCLIFALIGIGIAAIIFKTDDTDNLVGGISDDDLQMINTTILTNNIISSINNF